MVLVRRSIKDNWSIQIAPDFREVGSGQTNEKYYQSGCRTVWPLVISPNLSGRTLPPDLIGGECPEIQFSRGEVCYYGRFVSTENNPEGGHRLHGYAMADVSSLYVTVFFTDIADKQWAEDTFLSAELHDALSWAETA